MVVVRELLRLVMGDSGIELEFSLVELRELLEVHVVELKALPLVLLVELSLKLDIKL